MSVIVVTRLQLRHPVLLDEFFTDAVAAIEQTTKSGGGRMRGLVMTGHSLKMPA